MIMGMRISTKNHVDDTLRAHRVFSVEMRLLGTEYLFPAAAMFFESNLKHSDAFRRLRGEKG